jgi:hypothetical protein
MSKNIEDQYLGYRFGTHAGSRKFGQKTPLAADRQPNSPHGFSDRSIFL